MFFPAWAGKMIMDVAINSSGEQTMTVSGRKLLYLHHNCFICWRIHSFISHIKVVKTVSMTKYSNNNLIYIWTSSVGEFFHAQNVQTKRRESSIFVIVSCWKHFVYFLRNYTDPYIGAIPYLCLKTFCMKLCFLPHIIVGTWWCYQMETFSALLALCERNPPMTGGFPHKGQWRGALIFFYIPE